MPASPRRSRKQSGASSSSKPPELPVCFIDRSLGRQVIAGIIRARGARVEIHDDHFKPDEADEVWLAEIGRRGWIVLTKDFQLRYRGPALRAIHMSHARVFVLKKSGDLRGEEMAEVFASALPAIGRFVENNTAPFIAKVGRNRTVALWWPERTKKRPAP